MKGDISQLLPYELWEGAICSCVDRSEARRKGKERKNEGKKEERREREREREREGERLQKLATTKVQKGVRRRTILLCFEPSERTKLMLNLVTKLDSTLIVGH